jgi:hypothetical protein
MIHLAIKYFIRFGQLDIPSVGQLKLLKKEAELIDGVLKAPSEFIEFELNTGVASKQFYQYLGNALDISADQAAIQYEQSWESKFENDHKVMIGNLGVISKTEGTYTWESHFNTSQFYKDIEVGNLPNSETFETELTAQKNDKWAIWAIALAVIDLLAILLKQ